MLALLGCGLRPQAETFFPDGRSLLCRGHSAVLVLSSWPPTFCAIFLRVAQRFAGDNTEFDCDPGATDLVLTHGR